MVEVLEPRIVLSGTPYEDFLQITEIMYNPSDSDDYEFIELYNSSTSTTLNLAGVRITEGPSDVFHFAGSNVTSLGPGRYVLVVGDLPAFRTRYGVGLDGIIAGEYTGNLKDSGEGIVVVDPAGAEVHHVVYTDAHPWPIAADGYGFSLNLIDPAGNPDHADAAQWTANGPVNGSPGAANVATRPAIVMNEILAHTDPPQVDQIELYNPAGTAVHVGGWFLSDDSNSTDGIDAKLYTIPNGTWVPANGYGILWADNDADPATDPGPGYFGSAFLLSAVGETLYLSAGNGADLMGYGTSVQFGAQLNGESFGRFPDATGDWYPMAENTFGGPNSDRRVGPLYISEIMYHPPALGPLEFVEIVNPTDETVDLAHWQIEGIGYTFPDGATIGPGQVVVVVPFDPVTDAAAIAAFNSAYQVDVGASPETYMGPSSNSLSNSGERITLWHADQPPAEQPDVIPLIPEDVADYDDESPWPTTPDGLGDSLHRTAAVAFGDLASSWLAAAPTPGEAAFALLGDVNLDGQINGLDVDPFIAVLLSASYQTEADVNRDGLVNGLDVDPFVATILGSGATAVATPASVSAADSGAETAFDVAGGGSGRAHAVASVVTDPAAAAGRWADHEAPDDRVITDRNWRRPLVHRRHLTESPLVTGTADRLMQRQGVHSRLLRVSPMNHVAHCRARR